MSSGRRLALFSGSSFWIAHACFWLATFAAAMIVIRAFKPALPDAAWFVGSRVMAAFLITALVRTAAKNTPLLERLGMAARFVLNLVMLTTWSAASFGSQLLQDQRAAELRAFEAEALAARNELNHLQAQITPGPDQPALSLQFAEHDPRLQALAR